MVKGKEKTDVDVTPEASSLITSGIKHIRITLRGYENITPLYTISNLTVRGRYMQKDLGTSTETTITDDKTFTTHHDFIIECDINSASELNNLISHPIIFSVFENPAQPDAELLSQLGSMTKPILQVSKITSAESEAELLAAFMTKVVDNSSEMQKKGAESDKPTKGSKAKVKDVKEKTSTSEISIEPDVLIGTVTLDLLPLFTGKRWFSETLPIHQSKKFFDDQMVPVNIMSRVNFEVIIDEDMWLLDISKSNILTVTVESVYNLPNVMSESMHYKIGTLLPSPFSNLEPVIISGGKWRNETNYENMKQWPSTSGDGLSDIATKHRIDYCKETIKNKHNLHLNVFDSNEPRVEWNIMKRLFLMEDATREFFKIIKKYRHLPLELYGTSARETTTQSIVENRTGGKRGKFGELKQVDNFLHMMSTIDVSTLLYPGVKKCRVVCPLDTFQEVEIFEKTGLTKSCFVTKQEEIVVVVDQKKGSLVVVDKLSKTTGGSVDNKKDLKNLLPEPVVVHIEPSLPVFNEKSERTFVIIEIELEKSLLPKRSIENLTEQLLELLPSIPSTNKIAVTSRLAQIQFKDVIKQMIEDLSKQHQCFIANGKGNCSCVEETQASFVAYLQNTGVYQKYMLTITKAASVFLNETHPTAGEINRQSKEYQNFISNFYSFIIKQANTTLNEIAYSGAEISSTVLNLKCDPILFYAKEASEIGAVILANRYYLERICSTDENANSWFDYAIFQLEIGDEDKAYECVKQSLLIDSKHKYSLLLCGILLTEKDLCGEAETCFLTATFHYGNWVEGWATLHLFYSSTGNEEGADLCLEMASKYFANYCAQTDYFATTEDLQWSSLVCPHTIFFRTAVLLLKMRAFNFSEKAVVHDKIKDLGIYHYFLAIVQYYRKNYAHALIHLQEAEEHHGSDHAINSLKGHCFLALNDLVKAKEQYTFVLELFNRPDDLHLLYVYLALISDRLEDKQFARKLILLACKYSPTPYTWMACGLLYYGQRDLISAEQCLMQANLCDNRLPEIWGYLVLINLELNRHSEAELCYKQAKKNKLENVELLTRIRDACKLFKINFPD